MPRFTRAAERTLLALAISIAWELGSRFGPWPPHLFPGPMAVASSLARMIADGRLGVAVARSLARLLQGYLLAVTIGVPLGLLLARSQAARFAIKPMVMGLQALPSICWLPLAILWFGLNDWAIVFVVVMGSLLSISISTEDGVASIQPQLLAVAGTLGIRGPRLYLGVLLPAALPGIVTGLKLGWSFAWRALMAGELLFVSGGLGQLLAMGRELLDASQVMAVMASIVAIGWAVDRVVFQALEMRVRRRWGLVPQA